MKSVSDYLQSNIGAFNTLYYPGAGFDFSPFYLFALLGGTKQNFYADYGHELTEPIGSLGQNGFMRINRNGNEVLWPQICNQAHNIVGFGADQPEDYNRPDWSSFWHTHDAIEQGFSVNPQNAVAAFVKLRFDGGRPYEFNDPNGMPADLQDQKYGLPLGERALRYLNTRLPFGKYAPLDSLAKNGIQLSVDDFFYIVRPDNLKFDGIDLLLEYLKKRLANPLLYDHDTFHYLNTDGVGTASVLLQNGIKPDVVVLQDHGQGHDYTYFGYHEGQENAFYNIFQDSLPKYLFADLEAAGMWPGYHQVTTTFDPATEIKPGFTLPEIIQPMHNNQRALFKLNT